MVCFSPSHGFNEFTTIIDSLFRFPSIVFISEAFPFYENLLLAFVNSLIKDVLNEEFLNRLSFSNTHVVVGIRVDRFIFFLEIHFIFLVNENNTELFELPGKSLVDFDKNLSAKDLKEKKKSQKINWEKTREVVNDFLSNHKRKRKKKNITLNILDVMDKNINWNRLCQEINKKAEEAESERLNTSDSEKSINSNAENSQEEESDALNSEEKIDQVIAAMTMQANQTAPDLRKKKERKSFMDSN